MPELKIAPILMQLLTKVDRVELQFKKIELVKKSRPINTSKISATLTMQQLGRNEL